MIQASSRHSLGSTSAGHRGGRDSTDRASLKILSYWSDETSIWMPTLPSSSLSESARTNQASRGMPSTDGKSLLVVESGIAGLPEYRSTSPVREHLCVTLHQRVEHVRDGVSGLFCHVSMTSAKLTSFSPRSFLGSDTSPS